MGAITYDMEVSSSIPPSKMFKAFVLDADTLIPKILPHAIKSVETLEGDGGAGTIKLITLGEGYAYKSVKQRVDAIDKENFTYSYSVIEGDALMGIFNSISYHIKIVASADGGSVCKNRSIYQTKGSAYKSVKQRVDAIDKENFTYSYSVIEGDALMGIFDSISYHIKIVASADGGSVCKNRSIYQTKGDAQVTEEEIKSGKEKASAMFKAIEAYLMANPDA
ncbi:hypothetical protein RHGRI_012659 [Rhododendron griersonianum]|uniref:Bet v I/Major latex protein domain-containing protein n=1 Tax=Rhododendron griersonianum TaxID=479676 RepID=A0AAV6KRB5_9ERIC|nr:hypothetical protein RHGRI_012659 [Rhododendron griersonianum]